eukprot:TRINITY_DN13138_c0_g1_i1.p1 TRINITY_DN13138_c0_g1~~TRINITY_DN13138_c0_g1_i1.p1  ORF type:complete len:217 (-),score=16.59 TRINITY_DN13138_c0_g1_i1:60-710(-)
MFVQKNPTRRTATLHTQHHDPTPPRRINRTYTILIHGWADRLKVWRQAQATMSRALRGQDVFLFEYQSLDDGITIEMLARSLDIFIRSCVPSLPLHEAEKMLGTGMVSSDTFKQWSDRARTFSAGSFPGGINPLSISTSVTGAAGDLTGALLSSRTKDSLKDMQSFNLEDVLAAKSLIESEIPNNAATSEEDINPTINIIAYSTGEPKFAGASMTT